MMNQHTKRPLIVAEGVGPTITPDPIILTHLPSGDSFQKRAIQEIDPSRIQKNADHESLEGKLRAACEDPPSTAQAESRTIRSEPNFSANPTHRDFETPSWFAIRPRLPTE